MFEVDGKNRICFEKKEIWNVYELFHTRFSLHKRAYQHRVSTIAEHMLTVSEQPLSPRPPPRLPLP